jgi:putative transposase
MVTYTDLFTPNLFLIVNRTVGGEAVLANAMVMRVFQSALRAAQKKHHFRMIGYLFLPEQVQLVLEPEAGIALDQIIGATQQRFQADYQQLIGMPGALLLWEKLSLSSRLKDVEEFATQLDHLHYAPVQQRLVDKPEAWPYSSYGSWLARGLYPAGWGWTQPAPRKNE